MPAFILLPQTNSDNIWRDLNVLLNHATVPMFICNNIDELIPKIDATTKANDNILFMSNKTTPEIFPKNYYNLSTTNNLATRVTLTQYY